MELLVNLTSKLQNAEKLSEELEKSQ